MTAKTLLIGLDGADPDFIDRMIEDGELSNFKALRDASFVKRIENYPAQGAAQFWNSAAIGRGPDHHGHYFYMQFKPDTYDVIPNHESELPKVTPFWEELDRDGYQTAVIDWHRMPVNPLSHGLLIDNWLGHDPLTGTIWHPAEAAAETAKFFTGDPIGGGFACRDRTSPEDHADYLHHLLSRIDAKAAFCTHQVKEKDWDLFAVCFAEAHDAGHYYFHLEDTENDRYDPAVAAKVPAPMRQCYRRLDKAIGELMDAVGDEANIQVITGPGMENLVSANSVIEEITRRIDLGIGAPVSTAESAKQTYRSILPLNLRRRFAPLARNIRRRFANREYLRRRFFAIPHNDNAGAIRINVKGRERYGVVQRGADYDDVVAEIKAGVMSFKNPETGRSLVKRVICIPHDYDGPHVDVLPDIFVEWDRAETARNFKKISSEKYGDIDLKPELRTGDHTNTGSFWSRGAKSGLFASDGPCRPGEVTPHIISTVSATEPAPKA